jgi:nitroimidazol reductase NimA-like FMN-containing flavoprotein (pyridoxamine 5'-phosphate oxidase superfamily)
MAGPWNGRNRETVLRRAEKEITSRAEIEDVLVRARICHLGLCDGQVPYVVPMNYGYSHSCLYLHSAPEGRKIEALRRNSLVSFTMYVDEGLVRAEDSCKWGMRFKSVMGLGRASLVDTRREKEEALAIIMRHYLDEPFDFDPAAVCRVAVVKVQIDSVTGKKSGP